MTRTEQKYEKLQQILTEMGEVIVAYSGGVDSAFLLKVAYDKLGEKAMGVLATSATYPSREYERALKLADDIGVNVEVIKTKEIENSVFAENPVDRCYYCKSELFDKIADLAGQARYKNMVDGSNHDDLGDHRPGMRALKEKGIRSPLQEAGLTKNEIRELSKKLGLPTWNKDALACLSSRFPYGEQISEKKLTMVDQAENYLNDLGFRDIRARHTKDTIKIEVNPDQIKRFFDDEIRVQLVKKLKEIGYTYITIDLEGYRMGSLNEVLKPEEKKYNPGDLKIV